MGYDDVRAAKLLQIFVEVWPGVQAVRLMGSAALGLGFAACGRYDFFVHSMLYPWDVAAGIVLIREGGGNILTRDGAPVSIQSQSVVAGANGPVAEFLELTKGRDWR
jgi:fructose-1,6-bisphosphatase/inositol monophosphatase family enzyme